MAEHKCDRPDITFVNGVSQCGCAMKISGGDGLYSDVHYVSLCKAHRGTACSGFRHETNTCIHGHEASPACATAVGIPSCVSQGWL